MLGVSQYLPQDVWRSILQAFAQLPSGSEIVFNVVVTRDMMAKDETKMTEEFGAGAANFREPWQIRVRPSNLVSELFSYGFSEVEHLSPEIANERYFRHREDDLQAPYQI